MLEKISLGFLEDLKTPKGHFKINWPLGHFVEFHFFIARDILHIIVDIFVEFSTLSKGSLYTQNVLEYFGHISLSRPRN